MVKESRDQHGIVEEYSNELRRQLVSWQQEQEIYSQTIHNELMNITDTK